MELKCSVQNVNNTQWSTVNQQEKGNKLNDQRMQETYRVGIA